MRRRRSALVALLVGAALITGCSTASDDEPPKPSPAPASESTDTAEDADAVRFRTAEAPSTFTSCSVFDGAGTWLQWAEARVDRPVTFDRLELAPAVVRGLEVTEASYVAVPEGRRPFTAILHRADPPPAHREQVGWDDRVPLDGTATVAPGRYYVFLAVEVTRPSAFDDVELTWTAEDGTSGVAPWAQRQEFYRTCR